MRIIIIISCAAILISGCVILLTCYLNTGHEIGNRNHINKRIIEMFNAGRADDVYNFYNGFIKNRIATIYIISTALIFKIPVHYFIGLAYQESRFDFDEISKRNTDGSIDIGGYQLNSNQYKKYKIDYLLELENNIRLAGAHLTANYLNAGDWYTAVGIYNAGNENNVNFRHVRNILLYADMLDEKFADKF